MRRKNEGRNKLAGVGMGFLLCFALDFILCGDVMPKKYQNYYDQILEAKQFPFDLKAINPASVAQRLQSWAIRKKIPITINRTLERITINKKADA